jgi:gamma-glutamylcyclotransferase (GGCT)/AIG2-like uncharacterized protein YtfP
MGIRARAARAQPRPGSDSAIVPPSSTSLFAYGALADERRVAGLLARPVAGVAAELLDFERVEPRGSPFPVVLAADGERVAGKLYRHVSDEEFARLDAYEGVGEEIHVRDLARVVRPGASRDSAEEAWVYLPTGRTASGSAR